MKLGVIVLWLLLTLVVLLLAACGSKPAGPGSEQGRSSHANKQEPVTSSTVMGASSFPPDSSLHLPETAANR